MSESSKPTAVASGATPYAIVLTTAASQTEADTLAAALIEAQLAACISVFPMRSMYTWEGSVHNEAEWQLVIKTRLALFEKISCQIKALHSYDTPELIALPVAAGESAYLSWMDAHLPERKS